MSAVVVSSAAPRRRFPGLAPCLALAVAAAVVWLYAWTASSNRIPFEFRGARNDYYNLLTHGFLQGQTAMQVAPAREKVPEAEANGLGDLPYLLDASFYRGKYYLYFGPAPVLVFFLPYRVLTGQDVSDNFVGVAFAAGGYLVSLALVAALRRRYFPRASAWLLPLFALLLGLGNGCVIMLRHPMFYEATIACAYFFQAIFLLAAALALHASRSRHRQAWLTLASFAIGAAVAARASQMFATLALFVLLGWLAWREREGRDFGGLVRSVRRLALAGLGPLALWAAGLMAYNYARFGSIFEFGVSYQFTYRPVFGPQYLLHNLKLYYFALPEFSWYFPFTLPIDEGARPPGYVGFEHIHGQAWSTLLWPVVLVGAVLIWSRRLAAERALSVTFACAAAAYVCNLGVLLCLGGRANRYAVDFQPALMFLAAISVFVCGRELLGSSCLRRWLGVALTALVLVIGLHNLCSSLQLYELLKQSNPPVYARIATPLNAPTAWAGRWLYPRLGAVRLQLRFPAAPEGTVEPLVVTGSAEYGDFLVVRYLRPGWVDFELVHHGYDTAVSPPVEVGSDRPHALEIELGSLYPPQAHPFFANFSRGESSLVKRNLRISLDGQVVYATRHDFYDASPSRVAIGENPFAPLYAPRRFSGTIARVERAGLAPVEAQRDRNRLGAVMLRLAFPANWQGRRAEPLVVTGEQGRGDALFVSYEDDRHVRFALDHWGARLALSEPVEIPDPHGRHFLQISLGSLFPDASDPRLAGRSAYELDQLKSTAWVKLDGREVFRTRSEFHAAAPQSVDIGGNFIGMSSCASLFSGEIFEYERVPLAASAKPADLGEPMGPVRLRLTFPAGRSGGREPLVATGATGKGDVVFVSYVDDKTARISLDHWGQASIESLPVPLDYGQEHVLEIAMGSLYSKEAIARLALENAPKAEKIRRQLRVRLDGREVLAGDTDFYLTDAGSAEIGANRIGASSCGPLFTGAIAEVTRPERSLLSDAAVGPRRDYGPARFTLLLPEKRPPGAEPLLASGRSGAGDVVSISYPDSTHIRFTWDHWGAGGPSSELIAVDYAARHEVEIDMGSLYPEDSRAMKEELSAAEVTRRRRHLEVRWDGVAVLTAEGPFHPASATQVQMGSNAIGASGLAPLFTGTLEAIERPGAANR